MAFVPALLAGEPKDSPPGAEATRPLVPKEDLADQAALVQQIGQAAARGFDAEAHARELRAQIEALVKSPASELSTNAAALSPKAASAATKAEAPVAVSAKGPAPLPVPESRVQQALHKIRAALDELEGQLK